MSRPMRSDQWVEWLVPPPITGDRSVETVRLSIGKDFFSISSSIIRHSKVELFNKLLMNLEDQLKRDISKLGIIC